MEANEITRTVIGAAIRIHYELGPGLLESAYRACLSHELTLCGVRFDMEVALPIVYRGLALDAAYRVDFVVEDFVIVELKAVRKVTPIHEAQLLSYLKLSRRPVGLLINFHVTQLRHGIKRMVNQFGPRSAA